jgi:hypothetical protein
VATSEAAGRSVARTYYEAAVDYASDNGGVVPRPSTADWPAARVERGPVNLLNKVPDQRYLGKIPEGVTDGRGSSSAAPAPEQRVHRSR